MWGEMAVTIANRDSMAKWALETEAVAEEEVAAAAGVVVSVAASAVRDSVSICWGWIFLIQRCGIVQFQ